MQKVLRKRVLRNLRRHWGRYLALCLLVVLGVYMVLSLLGSAQNVIDGTAEHAQQNKIEDGEWETFIPLRAEQLQELSAMGIEVQEQFYLDFAEGSGATIRLFQDRASINLVELDAGRKAEAQGEIVLEKRFMEVHGLQVGDSVQIGGRDFVITGMGTSPDYESPLKKMSDSTVDSAQFGTGFVTPVSYQDMKESGASLESEKYIYAYRFLENTVTDDDVKEKIESFPFDREKAEDPYFKAYMDQCIGDAQLLLDLLDNPLLKDEEDAQKLRDQIEPNIHNLQMFVKREDNMRIGTAGADVEINLYASLVAGVIVLALFSYVIAVFTIHEIDAESSVIGALYSLGVNRRDLLRHYMFMPAVVTALGGVIGTILAYTPIGVPYQMMDTYLYFSVPALPIRQYAYILAYGLLVPPLIAVIVNAVVVRKKLSCTALFLLRGGRRESSGKLPAILSEHMSRKKNRNGSGTRRENGFGTGHGTGENGTAENETGKNRTGGNGTGGNGTAENGTGENRTGGNGRGENGAAGEIRKAGKSERNDFVRRFQMRRILREMRAAFTMAVGLYVSLALVFIAVDCYVMCKHVENDSLADTHYEYMYMYKYPDKKVPEGGTAAFARTMNKERFGYNLEVTLLGTTTENPYFDAVVPKGRQDVVISSAMAQKYGIKAGETMVLEDQEAGQYYAFRVDSIVQYAPGFMVFMDIDEMRDMFDEDDDYYNVVFSDHELDIDSGKLESVLTKAQIEQSGHVFVSLMESMVYMMSAISGLILFVVLYLMMGVMIDRASYDISLMKIFGYRRGEIRRLYLDGNLYFVAAGALMAIPLAKMTIDALYPYFISNVACAMDLSMSPLVYAGLFAAIMVMYFVINAMLVRKIDKVTPAEVLKNRE